MPKVETARDRSTPSTTTTHLIHFTAFRYSLCVWGATIGRRNEMRLLTCPSKRRVLIRLHRYGVHLF